MGIGFVFLGIQGAYMNRMYDELKNRPLYIVAEELNF
jgi:dolichol-phosphate mannosyltransferase